MLAIQPILILFKALSRASGEIKPAMLPAVSLALSWPETRVDFVVKLIAYVVKLIAYITCMLRV